MPPDSSQTICLPPIHRSTVALIWKILNVEDIKQYAICIKQFFSCPEFCRRHFWHNPSLPASTFFYLTTSPLERALKDMVLLAIHWQKHKLCLLILAKWSPWSLLIGKIINLVGWRPKSQNHLLYCFPENRLVGTPHPPPICQHLMEMLQKYKGITFFF